MKREAIQKQRERWAMECLRDPKERLQYAVKSQYKVLQEYNRRYPPSLVLKLLGSKVTIDEIVRLLQPSVELGLVEKQIFHEPSLTDESVIEEVRYYSLTQAGIQYLLKPKR